MGQVSEMIKKDGIKIGYQRGYLDGIENATTAHIIALLKEGVSIDIISRATKKSIQEILSIKEKNMLLC